LQHLRVGGFTNARIDQGAPAQAIGHQRTDITAQAPVHQAFCIGGGAQRAGAIDAQVARQVGKPVGEVAGLVFAAALQHGNPQALATLGEGQRTQTLRRHRPAITTAHHHHIKLGWCLLRARCGRQGLPLLKLQGKRLGTFGQPR